MNLLTDTVIFYSSSQTQIVPSPSKKIIIHVVWGSLNFFSLQLVPFPCIFNIFLYSGYFQCSNILLLFPKIDLKIFSLQPIFHSNILSYFKMQSKTCKIKHLPHKSIFFNPCTFKFWTNSKTYLKNSKKLLIFSLYISDSPASVAWCFLKAPLLALLLTPASFLMQCQIMIPSWGREMPYSNPFRGRLLASTVGSHESPKENSPKVSTHETCFSSTTSGSASAAEKHLSEVLS